MTVEIKCYNPEYEDVWEDLCIRSDDASIFHTRRYLEYCLLYNQYDHTYDKSFIVYVDQKPVAICPLLMQEYCNVNSGAQKSKWFAGQSWYNANPAIINEVGVAHRRKISRIIHHNIDMLAHDNDVVKASICYFPVSRNIYANDTYYYNPLADYGYIDESFTTNLIMVDKNISEIESEIYKNRRRHLKKKSNIEVCIYDSNNLSYDRFEKYMLMHIGASGGMRRPLESYKFMYSMMKDGHGILVEGRECNKEIFYLIVWLYKSSIYIASSCIDKDHDRGHSITHHARWELIKWLNANGYKCYDLGSYTYMPTLHRIPSKKEVSIARYKREWGGIVRAVYAGTKYYNREIARSELVERVDKYASAIGNMGDA